MLERLGIEVRDTPEGAVLIAIRPSRKHRPPTSDSAAPPGLDRRASHEDQIVNLGLMATDFPQYRLSFDRPEEASRSTRVTGPDPDAAHGSGVCFEPRGYRHTYSAPAASGGQPLGLTGRRPSSDP